MAVAYSMMVYLSDRACVVVGGGKVAERKIASLLHAKANVKVISPNFTPLIASWVDEGRIRAIQRMYTSQDTENAFLIIAATNDEHANKIVAQDALARNQLVNVVDRNDLSSFINPATFSRGKLQISVSTSGASPMLTKRICENLESIYGEEYEVYLDFLSEYRDKVKTLVKDPKRRQQIFKEMMQVEILSMIRDGKFECFKKEAFDKLGG